MRDSFGVFRRFSVLFSRFFFHVKVSTVLANPRVQIFINARVTKRAKSGIYARKHVHARLSARFGFDCLITAIDQRFSKQGSGYGKLVLLACFFLFGSVRGSFGVPRTKGYIGGISLILANYFRIFFS